MEKTTISILAELKQRGAIVQITNEAGISKELDENQTAMYVGVDPTADSLHVGHLLFVMVLASFQKSGHQPIIVIGGATGMIGDPSGKSNERNLLPREVIAENAVSIEKQLRNFLNFEGKNAAIIVDNASWTEPISILEFLRDIGKHFTVNYMMAKESVRRRLEDTEQGISVTEFCYMLLQAFDFLYLYQNYNCLIQGGGNDQWGNITAGTELIRRVCGTEAYGITFPLVTTASGEKFGKSAGNAIWLDPAKTSPFQFFQFWYRTDDKDVERYLKLFTFLDLTEIASICDLHFQSPEKREAQKILANEVTRLVHGKESLSKAQRASQVLFGGDPDGLSNQELYEIFADVPATVVSKDLLNGLFPVVSLLNQIGMCESKSEGRRLIKGGGIYINNHRLQDENVILSLTHLTTEDLLFIRFGKKNFHLVQFS